MQRLETFRPWWPARQIQLEAKILINHFHKLAAITKVGMHNVNRRMFGVQSPQQRSGGHCIMHVGRSHTHQQEQSQNISDEVSFAAIGPFSTVVANLVSLTGRPGCLLSQSRRIHCE